MCPTFSRRSHTFVEESYLGELIDEKARLVGAVVDSIFESLCIQRWLLIYIYILKNREGMLTSVKSRMRSEMYVRYIQALHTAQSPSLRPPNHPPHPTRYPFSPSRIPPSLPPSPLPSPRQLPQSLPINPHTNPLLHPHGPNPLIKLQTRLIPLQHAPLQPLPPNSLRLLR